MKKTFLAFAVIALSSFTFGQISNKDKALTPSLVDYEAFVKLVKEVEPHRQERLVTVADFNEMSTQKDVIILDTRSKAMYDNKHIKGALHLNFADFTQETLKSLIPSNDTKILIYCNNNIADDPIFFATKSYVPPIPKEDGKELTLALNIPTYINLYGYGYKNVYELSELISAFDARIQFEGTAVGGLEIETGNEITPNGVDIKPRSINPTK